MTNLSKNSVDPTQMPGRSLNAQASRAGWMDVKMRRGFNAKWVDHADPGVSATYEFGRHCALEYGAAGLEFPEWKAGKPMPQEIHDVLKGFALLDKEMGKLPTYVFPEALTALRPEWLVKEDLAAELQASGLGALASDIPVSQTY